MRPILRALALLLALLPASVAAQGPLPPAVVAVVDYQRVLREARAARSIRRQLEERRAAFEREVREQQARLVQVERELARKRPLLSPEAYAERRKAFEEEAARVQRLVQQRRRELDRAAAEAYAKVRDAVVQVVSELAEEKGFNLVLPSSAVLLFAPELDLTGAVLEGVDRILPEVRVPQAPEAGGSPRPSGDEGGQ